MNKEWYKARLRWAEMADRDGLRSWQDSIYLLRAEDPDTAFQQALEIGRRRQAGHDEDGQYVGLRFADVVTLDPLGPELPNELEVAWARRPTKQPLPDRYQFEPERRVPPTSF